MNKRFKSYIASALAALSCVSLAACTAAQPESAFDSPRPWQDKSGSYEKLTYAVTVYDTTPGADDDKRIAIASGEMFFELNESIAKESTSLAMGFSVTYNDSAPDIDKGLTDAISSTVIFTTNSLAAQSMTKSVTLANRENTDNLSYKVTADYHGTHEATYTDGTGAIKTLELSKDVCRDNEMMFFLARAQTLAADTTTMFKLVNIFESFIVNKVTEYTLYAQTTGALTQADIGDFVKDYGVEAVTNEQTGNVSYPVSCYNVMIGMSGNKSGPPYSVLYTEKPFTVGNKSHAKIPIRISYNEYKNSRAYRYTEYTLTSCSFDKPANA